ncbi:MAG: hypothetical protein ACQESV_02735 [Thermodesulfobacteriota bacterium]
MRYLLLISTLWVALVCSPTPARSGELYSEKELWAAGEMWTETKCQWDAEKTLHTKRMKTIEKMPATASKKRTLKRLEVRRHRNRSHILAAKRDQVHNVLINEANARVKSGKGPSSTDLTDTAGTKFGDKGHRGMAGDRDLGGGERTAHKVKEVLREMGIYKQAAVKEVGGTLEIGDDFELAINKTGLAPRAGTEFHRIKAEVDARNPETYVSESMKSRGPDGKVSKQAGTDYVEVQDHRKKAAAALAADGDVLATDAIKMQKMAKGTMKTLDMDMVDEATLEKILKQNGIKESPAELKQRFRSIKEGSAKVSDPVEAQRLRRTGEDIFNSAEQKAFQKAKREIVELRERAARYTSADPERLRLQEEIVDSVTKMKATRAAHDEWGRSKAPPDAPAAQQKYSSSDPGTRSKTDISGSRTDVDAELQRLDDMQARSGKAKAAKAFGAVMNIADIGQSCQLLEQYVEGDISLAEASTAIVDQHVTGGAIGTIKRADQTYEDYTQAAQAIEQANRQNMAAYLNAWELQFRKAGMSAKEARQYVASAMLAGNLNKLEDKAYELQARGKAITTPELVVETFEADDTWDQRALDTGGAVLTGVYEGGAYILTAPSRTVGAWAEGELREADLEEYADAKTAESKPEMFRKLLNAGIDSSRALEALHAWEEGKTGLLKDVFKEARANIRAAQPTPEELAAIEAENARLAAQAQKRAALLQRYAVLLNYLRFVPLDLEYTPNPVEIPREGERQLMRFVYTSGDDSKLLQVARELEETIAALTGKPGQVDLTWQYSCPGKPGDTPSQWLSASPGLSGVYPVTATLEVAITGPGMAGTYAPLARRFERQGYVSVDVALNPDLVQMTGPIWDTLRRAPVVSLSNPWLKTQEARITPGTSFTIPVEYERSGYRIKGEAAFRLSGDARTILEIRVNTDSTYLEGGELSGKTKIRLVGLELYSRDEETETRPAQAYYTFKDKYKEVVGTYTLAQVTSSGEVQWGQEQDITPRLPLGKTRIHFRMPKAVREEKRQRSKEQRQQDKAQKEAHKQSASAGSAWEGPFGLDEEIDGSIVLHISRKDKTVAGSFKGNQKIDEESKVRLSGEFLGAIDPDNGQIEAKLTTSIMFKLVRYEGAWRAGGMPTSMSKKTKVIGQLQGGTVTGHFELKGREGFRWSATPKTDEAGD